MPWSSPRSSGWRATDWIIEPKMFPMPTPAPSAPSPTPSASPMALPACVIGESDAALRSRLSIEFLLVLRLDRRADVDGGQGSEDEGLDPYDDDHLEEVERRRDRDHEHGQEPRLEDEHEADEREDQDVAGQHVREKTDGERDQPHELAEDLERHDQRQQRRWGLRNPALEVAHGAVPANAFEVGEHEREQRERERHGERAGGGIDSP